MSASVTKELDAFADMVLSHQPDGRARKRPKPKTWSVSVEDIFSSEGVRLDAAHFDPTLADCMESLKALGLDLVPLASLAEVSLPNRFERVWAMDKQHGTPYLNATDLLSLFAIGVPAKQRYLSRESEVDMDELTIRQNWLLMTCSGTIGRVFHVPRRLDGWAATHDLIRIAPKTSIAGYLFAWCMTDYAQTQVLSHTHGGQIDHVTAEQVGSMLVPILPCDQKTELNDAVLAALRTKEKQLLKLEKFWPQVI